MREVVADTCSLIRAVKGEYTDVLTRVFERIVIPEQVAAECRSEGLLALVAHPCFVRHVVETLLPLALDKGEQAVLSAAVELNIPLVLTDDEKAFRTALTLNLTPLDTFEFLIEAKRRGYVRSVRDCLDKMRLQNEGITDADYESSIVDAGE